MTTTFRAACAHAPTGSGARVVLVARNETKLEATKAAILKSVKGASIDTIVGDLGDLPSVVVPAVTVEALARANVGGCGG